MPCYIDKCIKNRILLLNSYNQVIQIYDIGTNFLVLNPYQYNMSTLDDFILTKDWYNCSCTARFLLTYRINVFNRLYHRISMSQNNAASIRWQVFLFADMIFKIDHLKIVSIFCHVAQQCWILKEITTFCLQSIKTFASFVSLSKCHYYTDGTGFQTLFTTDWY